MPRKKLTACAPSDHISIIGSSDVSDKRDDANQAEFVNILILQSKHLIVRSKHMLKEWQHDRQILRVIDPDD